MYIFSFYVLELIFSIVKKYYSLFITIILNFPVRAQVNTLVFTLKAHEDTRMSLQKVFQAHTHINTHNLLPLWFWTQAKRKNFWTIKFRYMLYSINLKSLFFSYIQNHEVRSLNSTDKILPKLLGRTLWSGFEPRLPHLCVWVYYNCFVISSMY
jgi:hypothetical protein